MVCLREAILTILYSITLAADAGCPSGLILANAVYKRSLATSVGFDNMSGAFNFYDPDIADNATNSV